MAWICEYCEHENLETCEVCSTQRPKIHPKIEYRTNCSKCTNPKIVTETKTEYIYRKSPLFLILFIVALIVGGILIYIKHESEQKYKRWYYSEKNEKASKNKELQKIETKLRLIPDLQNKISKYEVLFPIKITNIRIKNGKSNSFGTSFKKYDVTYLYPEIEYVNLSNSVTYDIKIRIISPSEEIKKSSNGTSPKLYTYTAESISFNSGSGYQSLTGWGNSSGGAFDYGTNVFEIWINNYCLASTSFKIR